ncbi:MAG: Franean1_4349 family RiPP [Anaerolineae bacterium]|jgi:hypothetical protein
MARQELERLIGRAVLDPGFREKLFTDPEKAIREAGFDLTEEEIAHLKSIDAEKTRALLEEADTIPTAEWK